MRSHSFFHRIPPWWRFPIAFGGSAAVLHLISVLPWVQSAFLQDYTYRVAAVSRTILAGFVPGVHGEGALVGDSSFSMVVLNVCNGTDLWILYTAGLIAFPAPIADRLAGMLIGLPALTIINFLRVIGLFLVGRFAPRWFDFTHEFLSQAIMVLFTASIFLVYLRWTEARKEAAS